MSDITPKYAINKTMKYLNKLIIFAAGLTLSSIVFAQNAADYAEMAKNKSYPGGVEESDLRILPASHFQKNQNKKPDDLNEGF